MAGLFVGFKTVGEEGAVATTGVEKGITAGDTGQVIPAGVKAVGIVGFEV